MLSRPEPPQADEDPAVSLVEQVLSFSSYPVSAEDLLLQPKVVAHALWICACVTIADSPTWLIYDEDGDLAWCRVPDRIEPLDLVDAQQTAGGHANPAEVLRWLRGAAPDPWSAGGGGQGDPGVLSQLQAAVSRAFLEDRPST